MPEYVMLMKGTASKGDWDTYIEGLIDSGKFRELIPGNPLFEAGGHIDILEEIPD